MCVVVLEDAAEPGGVAATETGEDAVMDQNTGSPGTTLEISWNVLGAEASVQRTDFVLDYRRGVYSKQAYEREVAERNVEAWRRMNEREAR